MNEPSDFYVVAVPARIADLEFQIAIPKDWNVVDLPAEEVDFSTPANFFPLMIAAAPWAAVVLTVAARPGFENGTVQDWALFLLDAQGIRPAEFGAVAVGDLHGLGGVGSQEQEGTLLEAKFVFIEDGGRLIHLGLFGPEAISSALEPVWKAAVKSFVLERPQGQNVPVGAGGGLMPESKAVEEEQVVLVEPEAAVSEAAATEPTAPEPAEFSEDDLGHYAKAADAATLDPEHPVQARLRDQGIGLTPRILELNPAAKTVRIGAGGIQAVIAVALGWHVIDDGKRTLLLDPEGKIQINLNVIPTEGRTMNQILDEIEGEAAQDYPDPHFLRLEDSGITALSIRNIAVNQEAVEQLHMLTRWAQETGVLRARITSDPESMRYAANYADLILKSAYYGEVEG